MSRQNPRSCKDIQDPRSYQDFQDPRSCQDIQAEIQDLTSKFKMSRQNLRSFQDTQEDLSKILARYSRCRTLDYFSIHVCVQFEQPWYSQALINGFPVLLYGKVIILDHKYHAFLQTLGNSQIQLFPLFSQVLQGVQVVSQDNGVLLLSFDDGCVSELVGCLNSDIKEVVRQFQEKNRFSPEFIPEMTEIISNCVRDLVRNAVASQVRFILQILKTRLCQVWFLLLITFSLKIPF